MRSLDWTNLASTTFQSVPPSERCMTNTTNLANLNSMVHLHCYSSLLSGASQNPVRREKKGSYQQLNLGLSWYIQDTLPLDYPGRNINCNESRLVIRFCGESIQASECWLEHLYCQIRQLGSHFHVKCIAFEYLGSPNAQSLRGHWQSAAPHQDKPSVIDSMMPVLKDNH